MRRIRVVVSALCPAVALGLGMLALAGEKPAVSAPSTAPVAPAASTRPAAGAGASSDGVAEARLRSRLLHETIHGALQVMHRDFFRAEQTRHIPSASLEDVFDELESTWGVRIKWLAVNANIMSVDHRPKTEFDRLAVRAIGEGREMVDASDGGVYRYAGKVVLGNTCLKCHVPDRTSLEDRMAALVITMPLVLREPPTE
jgi:hypothetical protein